MKRRHAAVSRIVLLVGAAALTVAGCDLLNVTGAYRGPMPARVGLEAEEVIVRRVDRDGARLLLDRVRYAGDPHNVDRVIDVATGAASAQIVALGLRNGDRLIVSTQFLQVGEIGDLPEIPDWPGHNYVEFPIGVHQLTQFARPAP